ncbi:MAG: DUF1036 domain-containing protein [Pseudomonadota bacterium]
MHRALPLIPLIPLCLMAGPALAGLEICNATGEEQSVAIGHMVDGIWTSEGWWNVADGACEWPIEEALLNRYYYYRAEVPGGTFDDDGYLFCVTGRAFTISEQDGCQARGYEAAGFALIDSGPTATHFKLTLVPPEGARSDISDAPAKSGTNASEGSRDLSQKAGMPPRPDDARFTRRSHIGPESWNGGFAPPTP